MGTRQFLQLSGFTRADRIQMTDQVSEAINQAGAWITDFHLYSNLLICINFEVSVVDLIQLAALLQATASNGFAFKPRKLRTTHPCKYCSST